MLEVSDQVSSFVGLSRLQSYRSSVDPSCPHEDIAVQFCIDHLREGDVVVGKNNSEGKHQQTEDEDQAGSEDASPETLTFEDRLLIHILLTLSLYYTRRKVSL